MRCTVIGTGYLGATHAAGMAELGHEVLGVDVDPDKIAKLSAGEVPFYEPGLRKMLRDNIDAGRLRFAAVNCGRRGGRRSGRADWARCGYAAEEGRIRRRSATRLRRHRRAGAPAVAVGGDRR